MATIEKMYRHNMCLSPEQSELYGQDWVPGMVIKRELGDGWVDNNPYAGVLAGNLAFYVRKVTQRGPAWQYQFMPIDNALLRVDKVQENIIGESDRITQELGTLATSKELLYNWLTLSDAEKQQISKDYGSVASPRMRAVNPLNKQSGERAAKMATLKDSTGRHNSGAVLAQGVRLEKDLQQRDTDLITKQLRINHNRERRIINWTHNENYWLDVINSRLDNSISSPSMAETYEIRHRTRNIHFRVQPFNQIAYEISRTPEGIITPDMAIKAQAGIQFHRLHNFLVLPFRLLASTTLEKLDKNIRKQADDLLPAVAERIEILEADENGNKYNKKLIGRLLLEATEVESALHNLDPKEAWATAKRYKWLQEYHCLPTGDPEIEVWYGHRL